MDLILLLLVFLLGFYLRGIWNFNFLLHTLRFNLADYERCTTSQERLALLKRHLEVQVKLFHYRILAFARNYVQKYPQRIEGWDRKRDGDPMVFLWDAKTKPKRLYTDLEGVLHIVLGQGGFELLWVVVSPPLPEQILEDQRTFNRVYDILLHRSF
ncbi:hypothetical protein A3B21_03930 [Candidatus Uhrbacteria bacterium RIFCSPLOWO2_01_FULL_47_24]|uniref:Uncharacterized protein n=1 Tax=Candidatus Uhrbacteria bacterium RIFCSPLOWO2_01_FULL_47_24 TaxID=1802401 RepID=A0A1F7UT77_9BACT|nr:MAG: hypothetical protein A2753_00675 [Candidatus Uhrbacteria bacterium RIFCSPHIGHO2_01_FULL_47_11]OGL69120.1 MAG: hypothetical protein A3D58_02630 [Candidatus Uhrbacteria bacterium RIFCSPHIGHO2_02_FULL_46_47]OGL75731.1 MAG: hypothetical protein A3F52_02355 [Candidatus Uhrbacteria bacterium RIFCSPHIGHO2_12_FULL_47_11]OGL81491.1 MAG: hypothetical protein A3B21_03930 [Candidatus Uhrbacteria bacterium RIFCSPLOWO2_01_FULL_47_24]OGL83736.1 MAG: hypothetical protein A3J03_01385 [Candidatus Uhrbact